MVAVWLYHRRIFFANPPPTMADYLGFFCTSLWDYAFKAVLDWLIGWIIVSGVQCWGTVYAQTFRRQPLVALISTLLIFAAVGTYICRFGFFSHEAASTNITVNESSGYCYELARKLDTVSGHFNRANSKIDRLAMKMDTVSTNFNRANSKIDRLAMKMDTVSTNFNRANSKIDRLAMKMDTVSTNFNRANSKIDRLAMKMDTVSTNFNRANSKIDRLAMKMDTIAAQTNARLQNMNELLTNFYSKFLSMSQPSVSYGYAISARPFSTMQAPDHFWRATDEWSDCSKPCQGTQSKRMVCVEAYDEGLVNDRHCVGQPKPNDETRVCNVHCHLKWLTESTSECSAVCGAGEQSQRSQCVAQASTNGGTKMVDDRHCYDVAQRPSHRIACYKDCAGRQCVYGDWEPCSVTCGGGKQTRTAACVDHNKAPLDSRYCENLISEVTVKDCNLFPCPTWHNEKRSKENSNMCPMTAAKSAIHEQPQ